MAKSYQPVASDEETFPSEKETLLQETEQQTEQSQNSKLYDILYIDGKSSQVVVWLCHFTLLSVAFTLFALSFCLRYGGATDATYTRKFSPYSPAASIVKYQTTRYNITPTQTMTEYVGYGPAVDQAWDYITYDVGDQMITPGELDRLGLDRNSLKIKDPKTGQEGYRAGMQVFHQLHCLNLLRQNTYKEYYSHQGGDIAVEHADLRGHLDHCIEVLRINLMCQSDIGVYTFKNYAGLDGHWPDFSTLHTCRNFGGIRDWAYEHAVVFGDEE